MAKAKPKPAEGEAIHALLLVGENLKTLKAVRIALNPDGVTEFSGANGAGKTTAMQILEWTLFGKDSIDKKPIRDGETEARSEVQLSNGYRAVRTYKRQGGGTTYESTITLYDENDIKVSSPQTVIGAWLAENAVDPLEFARMPPKERRNLLARVVGIDLDKFDNDEKAAEAKRAAHYGVYDTAKRKFEELPALPAVKPEIVDISDVADQINNLTSSRQALGYALQAAQREHGAAESAWRDNSEEITRLETEAKRLAERMGEINLALYAIREKTTGLADATRNKLYAMQAAQKEYEALPSIEPLQAQIANATEANKAANEYDLIARQRREAQAEWEEQQAARAKLTEAVEAVRAERLAAIKAAKFPVEGLGFEYNPDDPKKADCTYQGQPFAQASTGQQIRVGMAIAMAQNPTLKVITCRDWSLLDPQAQYLVAQIAQENGYQVLAEVVDTSGKRGVYIVDGEVAAVNPPAEVASAS